MHRIKDTLNTCVFNVSFSSGSNIAYVTELNKFNIIMKVDYVITRRLDKEFSCSFLAANKNHCGILGL